MFGQHGFIPDKNGKYYAAIFATQTAVKDLDHVVGTLHYRYSHSVVTSSSQLLLCNSSDDNGVLSSYQPIFQEGEPGISQCN